MTVHIAIIGLGQIGASFGLALGEKKDLLQRIGCDKDPKIAKQAAKLGAVDRIEMNPTKAVRDAQLVILCLPIDQIEDTVKKIAPELREGAVVMETGLAKEATFTWMKDLLPAGRYYVGLTQVINPAYLQDHQVGITASRSDLFKGGLMGILAPTQTDSEAIKLAADLTRLVGSHPLFADPMEIDGVMSSVVLLPQLMAAALVNATGDQPGWREARKVAGQAFADASEPILQPTDSAALSSALVHNQKNMLRLLDSLIAELYTIRNEIEKNQLDGLGNLLERARKSRLIWWQERLTGDYSNDGRTQGEAPEVPGTLSRLFGFRQKPKKNR